MYWNRQGPLSLQSCALFFLPTRWQDLVAHSSLLPRAEMWQAEELFPGKTGAARQNLSFLVDKSFLAGRINSPFSWIKASFHSLPLVWLETECQHLLQQIRHNASHFDHFQPLNLMWKMQRIEIEGIDTGWRTVFSPSCNLSFSSCLILLDGQKGKDKVVKKEKEKHLLPNSGWLLPIMDFESKEERNLVLAQHQMFLQWLELVQRGSRHGPHEVKWNSVLIPDTFRI